MTVGAEELPSFMQTAELLKISGLSHGDNEDESVPSHFLSQSSSTSLNDITTASLTVNSTPRTSSSNGKPSKRQKKSDNRIISPTDQTLINPSHFMDLDMTCVKEVRLHCLLFLCFFFMI